MTRYACLMRAVNVSGARKIKMAELRDLCTSLGYGGVETYLQSGNVILNTKESAAKLAKRLSSAICDEFGYSDVTVLPWTAGGRGRSFVEGLARR